MTADIVRLTSRVAYENPWLRVREDTIRRRDGSDGLYGVVERSDFVVVVPLQDGMLTLVEQYRYPIARRIWELPMGMWPDRSAASPETLAAAELREETGLVAATLRKIGVLLQGPGYCNQRGHVFLATGLTQGPAAREPTEQDMRCQAFALVDVEDMIRAGELQDGMTIAALSLLRLHALA